MPGTLEQVEPARFDVVFSQGLMLFLKRFFPRSEAGEAPLSTHKKFSELRFSVFTMELMIFLGSSLVFVKMISEICTYCIYISYYSYLYSNYAPDFCTVFVETSLFHLFFQQIQQPNRAPNHIIQQFFDFHVFLLQGFLRPGRFQDLAGLRWAS